MPDVVVKDLSTDELEELRVLKARGHYTNWRELVLTELGIKTEAGEE